MYMKNEIILSLIILIVISSIAEASNYSDFKKVLRNSLIDFFEKTSSGDVPAMTSDEIRDMIDFFIEIPENEYNVNILLVGESSGNTILDLYEKARNIETLNYTDDSEIGWCGDLFCNTAMGESHSSCCKDCGCPSGQTCINDACKGEDLTPRIAYWSGKVNQHTENGVWMTDYDGLSSTVIDNLTYCRKWYPSTTSFRAYDMETITTWRNAGNRDGPFTSTKQSYECVLPQGCIPDCAGRECGSDGCGGSYGTCGSNSYCKADVCECNYGFGDCDGNKANGCETNLFAYDINNCGYCGNACTNEHGTTSCNERYCVPVCSSGFGDCDDNSYNGCETILNTNINCGSCGNACGSTEYCSNGECTYISIPAGPNEKDMSRYSGGEVFLVSDADWKDVLQLVPVTTWTGNERCNNGYGTPDDVCVYPTLIFHREEDVIPPFDADSIIYFMQQYSLDRLTIIGDTPQELDNLLVAAAPLGAGLSQDKIKRISINDALYYWEAFDKIVYVQDDYETALLASTYASLLDVPLVIEGTDLDRESLFQGRDVICVGNVDRTCSEKYSIQEMQEKYASETGTDKMILVNPNDLDITVKERMTPDKSSTDVYELYGKTSMASPFLGSSKHELLVSTTNSVYQEVDELIDNKANLYGINYLTIVAAPNAIDASYNFCEDAGRTDELGCYYSTDAWYYAEAGDGDEFLDMAVGRIYGMSVSDVSSNIARSIFYDETTKHENSMLVTRGHVLLNTASVVYVMGSVLSKIGYDVKTTPSGTKADDWKDKSMILYTDHGNVNWAGISNNQIPYLDNSIIISEACLTCSFDRAKGSEKFMFCTNALRKGAVAYIGAVDVSQSPGLNKPGLMIELFSDNQTIGDSFIISKNALMTASNRFSNGDMPRYMLLGDPTLKPLMVNSIPQPTLENSGVTEYTLKTHVMKFEIPEDVVSLNQDTSMEAEDYYFIDSVYQNRQLIKGNLFAVRIGPVEWPGGSEITMPSGWTIMKEAYHGDEYIWIVSKYIFDQICDTVDGIKTCSSIAKSYFPDANDESFTEYGFVIEVS
ncbi:MAG: hypothetical protein JW789_02760 [Candidatus Aenigmarchaeota archaeon]|nr:hypothetical protein [Candidatus Aenigmarchaeota archaeon]